MPNGQDFYTGYHIFAVDWTPTLIEFSVDGNVYRTLTAAEMEAAYGTPGELTNGVWQFGNATTGDPFYIILDICEGGPLATLKLSLSPKPCTWITCAFMPVNRLLVELATLSNSSIYGQAYRYGHGKRRTAG